MKRAPRPYIRHFVCQQSGIQELWLLCGDKVLGGPERLPDGWVALYNAAMSEARDADIRPWAAAPVGAKHA